MIQEPHARFAHRMVCKHHSEFTNQCYKHSGMIGRSVHITMACTGNCPRMKNWDAKNGFEGVEFKLKEEL